MAQGRQPKQFKSPLNEEEEGKLATLVRRTTHDPYKYASAMYPWALPQSDLEHFNGPKSFQKEVLQDIGEHLSNPETRHTPYKCAIASGKGIGKTALIAMIVDWGLSSHIDTKIRVTANTEDQLRLVVWAELRKWRRMALNEHWFADTATALSSNIPGHGPTWRADAMTWSLSNLEAFAGFHNYGKRLIAIIDEGSGIDDGVFDNMEGFLTDANTELLIFVFGNPTKKYGRFYEIFEGKNKNINGWKKFRIDSRTVEGMNHSHINQLIREHGIDSDIVKVTVRGQFPDASFEQFVNEEVLMRALGRDVTYESQWEHPAIIGVDPAHSGDDIAITVRKGDWCKVLECFKKPDGENDEFIATKVMFWEDEYKADAVFIDLGWGTGVKTVGDMNDRYWTLIAFGGGSSSLKYKNKRAQMLAAVETWMKNGGSLNGDEKLKNEIAMPEKRISNENKILAESKADMESRLKKAYESPGRLDSLMLTFAKPVVRKLPADPVDQLKQQWETNAREKGQGPEGSARSLNNMGDPRGSL